MTNHSFDFPQSKYGIEYQLLDKTKDFRKGRRRIFSRKAGRFFWKGNHEKLMEIRSPFEALLERLENVIKKSQYPIGSAIIYLREIFEPDDSEFDKVVGSPINAAKLSQEQVDRLRLMILPRRREETLVEYLEYFSRAYRRPSILMEHFDGFGKRYSKLGAKEKFDVLFSFSFAIRNYPESIQRCTDKRRRERIVLALARHWRSLIENFLPSELGLDEDFSYPALMHFLYDFKREIENVDTIGGEPLRFILGKEILIAQDEQSVSTMTKSVHSRVSL